eukprot:gene18364-24060_t
MNAFKNLLNRLGIRINIPSGGGGGGGKGLGAAAALLAIGSVATYGAYKSIVIIQPGHVGIIYNRFSGLRENVSLRDGINFVIPWFERPIIYDIRTRPQLVNTNSGSKDLQMVQISLRILFRPDPSNLVFIYRMLGLDYDARVLPSIVNEVTKAVVAQYNAAELLTKREIVSRQIRDMISKRSADFKIVLDDVSVTHLAFSKEYTAAVEAKQVAQQDAERAKYTVERAIQEKRTIIIKADGEAKSAELIGKAISTNPAFLQLRRIETSKEIANLISQSNNKIYLSSDSLLVNQLGEPTDMTLVKPSISETEEKAKKNGSLW